MSKIFVLILISLFLGCSYNSNSNQEPQIDQPAIQNQNQEIQKNQERIGGQRDEHGCLGPAGYTWCEKKQKCLRTWEEPCE